LFATGPGGQRIWTLERPLDAECDEGVEQRRRGGPARDGDADGHEQVACLPATRLRQGAEGRFELIRFE
jgi:hypothetical protein